ncbi:MAG: hypothetical protein ACE5EK_00155 [Nitrospinales bacterium]
MSNRKGKREREAGNRHKRGSASTLNGAEWITLKLGRKKLSTFFRKTLGAIPVADSRKGFKSDV